MNLRMKSMLADEQCRNFTSAMMAAGLTPRLSMSVVQISIPPAREKRATVRAWTSGLCTKVESSGYLYGWTCDHKRTEKIPRKETGLTLKSCSHRVELHRDARFCCPGREKIKLDLQMHREKTQSRRPGLPKTTGVVPQNHP
jgi:hypothetical protein